MAKEFSSGISTRLKALGIYQIIGGVQGIVLTIWLLTKTAPFSGLILPVYLIALALYFFSIYCGSLLLKQKETGLNLSLINQFLQLVNFTISGFAFKYVSGIDLTFGLSLPTYTGFKIDLGISSWIINLDGDEDSMLIYLNFIALYLIIFISKLKKKISAYKLDNIFSNPQVEN